MSTPRPPRWQSLAVRVLGHLLDEDGDLLTRWRARMTAAFLGAAATLGLLPAVSTIAVGLRDGVWALALLDITLVALVYWLLLSRRATNRWRNVFLTVASFSVGVTALLTLGPFSTALSWLLIAVFLATFLLGARVSVGLLVLVTAVLTGVTIGIEAGAFAWSTTYPDALARWYLTAFDFFFISIIFAGANGLIIRVLETEDRARTRAEARLAEGRRNEALGTLAGGIAHDFNNLLVPVLANVEAVRDALPSDERSAPLRDALRDAHRSAERARDLVRRILAFGRGVDSQRSLVDPVAVARDVVALARHGAPEGVTLTLEAGALPPVFASVAELHQVLHNLVANAVLAVQPPGMVRVTIAAQARDDRRGLQCVVTDSGVGMDAATVERIFDPYFSTRAEGRGTGLGLPIVHSIVTSLGGDIRVVSAPGAGSTFTVWLPFPTTLDSLTLTPASSPRVRPTPAYPSRAVAPGLRVLLVDDEASVRRATSRLLESLGCEVTTAAGADEALTRLSPEPGRFDVLITDHRMPGTTGAALLATVRARRAPLPVVLMSGHLEDATAEADALDDVVLLQKPFARQELAAALEAATAHG